MNGSSLALSRRKSLKGPPAASVTGLLAPGDVPKAADPENQATASQSATARQAAAGGKFIGIQVGAVSFVDEGVDKVLDLFQEKAGINALMLAVFTYGRGIAGRQVPGQPLPDHGAQEYDSNTFHGGFSGSVPPSYYSNTIFKDFRAPDLRDVDMLCAVVPKAQSRPTRSFCRFPAASHSRPRAPFL